MARSTPILLKFAPGTDRRIRLGIVEGKKPYDLEPPDFLSEDLLDELQSGSVSEVRRIEIGSLVRKWLLGIGDANVEGNGVARHFTELSNPPPRLRLSFVYDQDLERELLRLPLELALVSKTDHLALFGPVSAVVHELEAFAAPPPTVTPDWPLRVLLFRSSPKGMDPVPSVAPIADAIRMAIPGSGDRILLDVVSSETDGAPPATFGTFLQSMERGPHVALFLGHGILTNGKSYLAFENNAREIEAIPADMLRIQLQNGRAPGGLPLLVLVACLSAAPPAATASRPSAFLGFAQELIRSSLGVNSAIGMRARIGDKDAQTFVRELFKALVVGDEPGDVGAAVKAARLGLHALAGGSIAPFAPMLMQTKGVAPGLEFLQRPLVKRRVERDEKLLEQRRTIWAGLAKMIEAGLPYDDDTHPFGMLRRQFDEKVAAGVWGSAVLWPEFVVGSSAATIAIRVLPAVQARELRFSVLLAPEMRVRDWRRAPSLPEPARVFVSRDTPSMLEILIRSAPMVTLGPELVLLDVEVPATPTFHELGITFLDAEPDLMLLGESNALLVKP